ncbi:MAG: phosphate regulon transcriptional regulator PhoB [Pseudomonadota bacterium]
MQKRILIVEDEAPIREMVDFALARSGMDCIEAEDVRDAQNEIMKQVPDLILLDWMLPGMSGIDYARRLRKEELTKDIPIIMLTARGHEDDRIRGLETGADDYLVKPFSTRELVARINAVIRRASPTGDSEVIESEGLKIDLAAHRAFAGAKPLSLGPTEFRLLSFLMSHPERVYSRSQLLDHVWGGDVYVDERTVDVHIRRVRKALEPHDYQKFIQTVRGAGYRFSTTV